MALSVVLENVLDARQRDGRPLSDGDLDTLTQALPSSKAAAAHYRLARDKFAPMIQATCDYLYETGLYAKDQFGDAFREKTARDMTLCVWYCGDGLVLGSLDYPRDTFHFWFRSIMHAFEYPERSSPIVMGSAPVGAGARAGAMSPGRAAPTGRTTAVAAAPAPAAQRSGLFGMGRAKPTEVPRINGLVSRRDPAAERIGQEIASKNIPAHVHVIYDAYTFLLTQMETGLPAVTYEAWKTYIADARDVVCARTEPGYA